MIRIKENKLIIGLLAIALWGCGTTEEETRRLPIVGEVDVHYRMVNGKEIADTIYHKVPDFKYINQDSVWISSSDLKDKIWVTDFFFTHCPTICPPMTTNMKRLNIMTEDLKNHLQFLSFSIDPYRDNPTRLRAYIAEHGIKATNWYFFTGEEEATHNLAKEFFNGAEKDETIPGGFGHTPYFALVDTKGHVRGIYDGTNSDAIDSLANDIRILLKTEYNVTGSKN
ncbi:SCO family protein [Crocinitomicaceae bacterium CZZ-1]|uniref:SCO family protein n=1 Tax=Taishania pollutisoli TaxID=2766479 RepID=A0A8J6TZ14_9FLAO|nr:SCO family protein [Taishania pollutisoli]MBC9811543.1 SCO family protein [Taishania pollutisoli]NGF76258.1 SCO family protein [Fluviicola sp. SGL-29]